MIGGWTTAELGRQPWLVYGLYRTAQGSSPTVHAGTALFTLLGFCGPPHIDQRGQPLLFAGDPGLPQADLVNPGRR